MFIVFIIDTKRVKFVINRHSFGHTHTHTHSLSLSLSLSSPTPLSLSLYITRQPYFSFDTFRKRLFETYDLKKGHNANAKSSTQTSLRSPCRLT